LARRPRLSGAPGSPDFIASFSKAHSDRIKSPPGVVSALIVEFRASGEFRRLAPKTRQDYSRYFDLIGNEFGDLPLRALDDPRIRGDFFEWRDRMAATPRKADFAWTVFALLLAFGKNRGRLSVNPCERGGRLYVPNRADNIWTPDAIRHAQSTLPAPLRWAFVLALWTGQRQGDLLRLAWSDYDGDRLRFRQSKTGRRLVIPVGETLRDELARIPYRSPTILTNSYGRPWTSDGFRAFWGRAIKSLGISGLTFHDLRGSAITRLAEAGCSESEIAAFTGHSHRDVGEMLDRHYMSRTNALAESGMQRLERAHREQKL
jgi:integrase